MSNACGGSSQRVKRQEQPMCLRAVFVTTAARLVPLSRPWCYALTGCDGDYAVETFIDGLPVGYLFAAPEFQGDGPWQPKQPSDAFAQIAKDNQLVNKKSKLEMMPLIGRGNP